MPESVWLKLLDQLPSILTAMGVLATAILSAWSVRQSKANAVGIEANAVQIETQGVSQAKAIEVVRLDVNDKMQQLLETTSTAEHAKGVLQGKAENTDPIQVQIMDETAPVKVAVVEDDKKQGA